MKSIYQKLFIKILLVCAFCLSSVSLTFAENINDLKIDKYVNDFANIIDDNVESELNAILYNNFASTTNQIIVVTVTNMDGDYIENYSIKLAEKIKAGSEQNDNGVLLLVARDERKLRIEVGYGLEGYLTDLKSKSIIDGYITPEFKNDNYTAGIRGGVEQILKVTTDSGYEVVTSDNNTFNILSKIPGEVYVFIFFIIITLFEWLVAVLGRTKSWWLGGVIGFVIALILFFFIKSLFVFIIALFGFVFDYLISKNYKAHASGGKSGPPSWWAGGTGFGGGSSWSNSGGGFSGGGGGFGGGGSSGSW